MSGPATNYLYVINSGDNTISVVDTGTNTLISTIRDPAFSLMSDLVLTPDGQSILILNQGNNSVLVLDVATNKVTKTIIGLSVPHHIAIQPGGAFAYITNNGGIQVFNLETLSVVNQIVLQTRKTTFTYPFAIATAPNGDFLYVTTYVADAIIQVDNLTKTSPTISLVKGIDEWTLPSVLLSPDSTKAYALNTTESSLLIIDTETNSITNTVSLSNFEATAAAISVDGTTVYITNQDEQGVIAVDLANNNAISYIPCNQLATSAIALNSQYAYVTTNDPDTVCTIDISSHSVIGTPVNVGTTPSALIIVPKLCSPNCFYTYALFINAPISVLNTTNAPINQIDLPGNNSAFAMTPNGQFIYAGSSPNNTSSEVVAIDVAAGSILSIIPVADDEDGTISSIAISSDGNFVYVVYANSVLGTSSFITISTASNTILNQTPFTGGNLGQIALTPNDQFAYVTNSTSPGLSYYNLETGAQIGTIDVPGYATAIIITPDGNFAYVTSTNSPYQVNVVSLSSNSVIDQIPLPENLQGVSAVITPDGQFVYVAAQGLNQATSAVLVIEASTNTIIASASLQSTPNSLTMSPSGLYVYCSEAGLIEMIDTSLNVVVGQVAIAESIGLIFQPAN